MKKEEEETKETDNKMDVDEDSKQSEPKADSEDTKEDKVTTSYESYVLHTSDLKCIGDLGPNDNIY